MLIITKTNRLVVFGALLPTLSFLVYTVFFFIPGSPFPFFKLGAVLFFLILSGILIYYIPLSYTLTVDKARGEILSEKDMIVYRQKKAFFLQDIKELVYDNDGEGVESIVLVTNEGKKITLISVAGSALEKIAKELKDLSSSPYPSGGPPHSGRS